MFLNAQSVRNKALDIYGSATEHVSHGKTLQKYAHYYYCYLHIHLHLGFFAVGCSPPSMPSIVFCLLLSCSRWFLPSL